MKVLWAILCQNAVIDRDTNTVSLFNVVEEVTVPVAPPSGDISMLPGVVPATFELVILWSRSETDEPELGMGRIALISPDSTSSTPHELNIDLTQYLRWRSRIKFPGLPITGEGTYTFQIEFKSESSDWVQVFELPLRVAI